MYNDEQHNDFQAETGIDVPVAAERRGELGAAIAGLSAVAMLTGIAIAIHMWVEPGWERTVLIMAITGASVWVLAAFALHLGSERAPLLGLLLPTVVFLGVMITVIGFSQYDYPKGIERLQPAAATMADEAP